MENPNLAVKARLEKAAIDGDWEAAAKCVHPNFVLHEPPGFPYGRDYKGFEGFRAYLPNARTYLRRDALKCLNTYVSDDPDRISYEMYFRGAVVATGAPVESTIMEVITFQDGMLLSVRPHWFNPPIWTSAPVAG